MRTRISCLLLATVLLAGCRTGRNYPDTTGPRYAGRPAGGASVQRAIADTIHVAARRDQFLAILADAAKYPRVVIGGDLNSSVVGRLARDIGYAWPTERGPHTTRGGRWDHIFFKGFTTPGAAGTVRKIRGASDHLPVWAIAIGETTAGRRALTNSNQDKRL